MKKHYSIFLFLLLWGCESVKKDLTTDVGTLTEAKRLLDKEFYEEARKQYFRIKTEFPESAYQAEADLKIAESYYQEELYSSAATSYEEFTKTYPGRSEVPEALFQLGMCYVKQMPSSPQRDTRPTEKAVKIFSRLLIEYPQTEKYSEAQNWMEQATNQLAHKIFTIAQFYQRKKVYHSAARRFGQLALEFPTHALAEESMALQIVNLKKANQIDKAQAVLKTFQERYPNSKWKSLTGAD